jgi:Biopolymer transport proteins
MHPTFALLLFDAYFTSSWFNKIICWIIVACGIWVLGLILYKLAELDNIKKNNFTFFRMFKKPAEKGLHPAALYIEMRAKISPNTPLKSVCLGSSLSSIYCSGMQQLLSIMHKRGFADADVLGMNPDAGAVAATISDAEMRSVEACVNSELADQNLFAERLMSMLGSLTNCSTSVGLLGTVYGVMESFMAMKEGGASMISQVAPGISGALLTTVLGLVVAIPGTIAYNSIADMIKEASVKAENFADELISDIAKKHKIA